MPPDSALNPLPDEQARRIALTDHERTLLVEAGAGSGKTALMAGRVAMLLAAGEHPGGIVAITFTEAAAAELRERIEQFVQRTRTGDVPKELQAGFPQGISVAQRNAVDAGARSLNEITCTTIHGFCQRLIGPYAVETGLDPGARIIDPATAELAYQDLIDRWLSELFGRTRGPEELGLAPEIRHAEGHGEFIAELVSREPAAGMRLLRRVSQFLKEHRTARAPHYPGNGGELDEFLSAVELFGKGYRALGLDDSKTEDIIENLERVATFLRSASQLSPRSKSLVQQLFHERPSCCLAGKRPFKLYQFKGRWIKIARQAGLSTARGEQMYNDCADLYKRCGSAYLGYCTLLGDQALRTLLAEFEVLPRLYRQYKRNAALLDFDDLLHHANELLRSSDAVRNALAERYPRILVDEFQDTDPLQCQILWRLAGEGPRNLEWQYRALRPGALFLVGDPKQAIYRFRGADVRTYLAAKDSLRRSDPGAVLEVHSNFRSQKPILEHVNLHFEEMLGEHRKQPGFTKLTAVRKGSGQRTLGCFHVQLDEGRRVAQTVREKEASVVTDLVLGLLGKHRVWDSGENAWRPARASDIALVAPTGTQLWIYERALEQRGVRVASQAGKGFFRRQEVQDLIAIARAITDPRDTLAFGALLRGPLVGLTEEQIADEIEALRAAGGKRSRLYLWTPPQETRNKVLRNLLVVLQNLARKAKRTAPYLLLSEAVDELNIRAILRARHPRGAERALGNVELVLEMSRAFAGRGIAELSGALRTRWEDGDAQVEGRPDAAAEAVSIMTIHSAKGLERPIVIPINTATGITRRETSMLYRHSDNTVHIRIFGFQGREHADAAVEEADAEASEHIRLWYVALTRARDLLLMPVGLPVPSPTSRSMTWYSLVHHTTAGLILFEPEEEPRDLESPSATASRNRQRLSTWKKEAGRIAANQWHLSWHRPSRHEEPSDEPTGIEDRVASGAAEAPLRASAAGAVRVHGGQNRGLILHKLLEEVLSGEVSDDRNALLDRAARLIAEVGLLDSRDASAGPSSEEMALTVHRTLQLPQVAEIRDRLLPEVPLYASQTSDQDRILSYGIADAVTLDPYGRVDTVVDWKSDVVLDARRLQQYRKQVREYLRISSAHKGLLVFLTRGEVHTVTAD